VGGAVGGVASGVGGAVGGVASGVGGSVGSTVDNAGNTVGVTSPHHHGNRPQVHPPQPPTHPAQRPVRPSFQPVQWTGGLKSPSKPGLHSAFKIGTTAVYNVANICHNGISYFYC